MRTVREWWRWFSVQAGSPWMAAVLIVFVIGAPTVVTVWAIKDAVRGVHVGPARSTR